MNARVEKSALAAALKIVLPAAKAAQPPIRAGVRLDANGERLTLTATDFDLTIVHEIEIAGGEGSAIVPAALLARVVSSFDDGAVTLEWADDMLTVACGEAVAKLHGFNMDDWPRLPGQDGEPILLDEPTVDLLRRIVPFASQDTTRPMLCTVHFGDRKVAVTDSYRMALADLDVDVPECNVPAAMFATMLRTAGAPVTLTVGSRSASLHSQNTTWTTRLVEGDYPKLERLITKGSRRLTFAAGPLVESLSRLLVTTDDKSPQVTIAVEGDKARLSSSALDVGSMDDVVPCFGDFDGPIIFDPRYLADLVAACASDEVTLELVDALKPATVHTERLTQVLVPVRPS